LALIDYAPLIVLLLIAAAEDVRARRVPNWISLGLVLSGVVLSCTSWGQLTLTQALLGLTLGLAIGMVLHLLGAIGAGDAKLLAGVGVWIGPVPVIVVFAGAAIIGMCIAIVMSVRQGRLKEVIRGGVMLGARIGGGTQGMLASPSQHVPTDLARQRTVPFAVAIAISTIGVIVGAQIVLAGRS
jgi:prepilin peptidase CpaA